MKKPYVIEFLGMPRSGKTTQIKLLKKYFELRGKKVCGWMGFAMQRKFTKKL